VNDFLDADFGGKKEVEKKKETSARKEKEEEGLMVDDFEDEDFEEDFATDLQRMERIQ
jgi:hypothetical protein